MSYELLLHAITATNHSGFIFLLSFHSSICIVPAQPRTWWLQLGAASSRYCAPLVSIHHNQSNYHNNHCWSVCNHIFPAIPCSGWLIHLKCFTLSLTPASQPAVAQSCAQWWLRDQQTLPEMWLPGRYQVWFGSICGMMAGMVGIEQACHETYVLLFKPFYSY